ncbi:MAG TPA: hypothetical protein VHT05_13155 [Candidatus Elarobacter sp.]|nr:hypothetical protein [Candidatus Elarobacter sp.]
MLYALILALAIPTYGPMPAPTPSAPAYLRVPHDPGEALIVNSGSTNRAGYRLRVFADGTTTLQQGDVPLKKQVSITLVKRFFADLKAAGALDKLSAAHCMKSTSFGSTTQIGYMGKMSPDVSCPGAPPTRALQVDADALADAAGVSMLPR